MAADLPSGIDPGALGFSQARVGAANAAISTAIDRLVFISLSSRTWHLALYRQPAVALA
jgi:hypothetical protein